jgi:hypothetical protein
VPEILAGMSLRSAISSAPGVELSVMGAMRSQALWPCPSHLRVFLPRRQNTAHDDHQRENRVDRQAAARQSRAQRDDEVVPKVRVFDPPSKLSAISFQFSAVSADDRAYLAHRALAALRAIARRFLAPRAAIKKCSSDFCAGK